MVVSDFYVLTKQSTTSEMEGELPPTYQIPWQGWKPQVVGKDFSDRAYWYYYAVAHDPANKRIIVGFWKYDTAEPSRCSGYGFKVKIGNIVKSLPWGITEIKYKCKGQQTIEVYNDYIYHGAKRDGHYHHTYFKTTINGNDNETKIVSIGKPADWFGFMLEANKAIEEAQDIINEIEYHKTLPQYLLNYYDLSKSTAMYAIPVNMEFHGLYATSASQQDLEYAKKIWGYDVIKLPTGDKYHGKTEYAWVGLWPKGCTKEEFRNGMVNTYRDKAIGWKNEYSPILDVIDMVRQVKPNVIEAKLTIYGDNLNAIRVEGPYDSKPEALTTEEIVSNWEKGEEWERQYCSRNGKWYWVIYPCKLDAKYIEISPPVKEHPPTPFERLLQLLRILFPFLPLQRFR